MTKDYGPPIWVAFSRNAMLRRFEISADSTLLFWQDRCW